MGFEKSAEGIVGKGLSLAEGLNQLNQRESFQTLQDGGAGKMDKPSPTSEWNSAYEICEARGATNLEGVGNR